ncbi:hypothetical protein [Chengkuizengella marina]|uniref:Ferric reductase like transmembrane component n=1 Tax=Chengkuizengella marina TaxID=2507566 RepID=A0A6N9Q355_9BACL|nr:hypothetical protein [Chengkuizengella marina]NBI29222.1 hypothetical protein [Chengkuizengella marina]
MVKKTASSRMIVLRGFLIIVLVVSFLLLAISFINLLVPISIVEQMKYVDGFLTKITVIFTIAAILLLGWGKLWKGVRKNKNLITTVIQNIWLFFKKRHVLFGWLVAAAGTAHSIYFTIYLPEQMIGFWSGVIAFFVMIVLVVLGYYFNQKAKSNPKIGKFHLWLGVLFFIAFVYHFIDSKGGQFH